MKELNERILKNFRDNIAISNVEEELNMKKGKRKQVISLCATVVVLLSGSFLTVNAATDGKLAENILEKYREMITIEYDGSKYKIVDAKEEKLPTGENTVTYEIMSNDNQEQIDTVIMTDNLEEENLKITVKDKEEDGEGNITAEVIIEEK